MRRISSALLGLLFVVASMAVMAPSAAAVPQTFRLEYGNTYSTGTVTFYNRTVYVVGEQKAQSTSGCRYTDAEAFNSAGQIIGTNRSQITCGGSEEYDFVVPANVVGGAAYIHLYLVYYVDSNNYRDLDSVRIS